MMTPLTSMADTTKKLSKKEMEVILSSLLMMQVVTPCYESVVFDLSQTWELAPVLVKDELELILNNLVVALVRRIESETKSQQERLKDSQVDANNT